MGPFTKSDTNIVSTIIKCLILAGIVYLAFSGPYTHLPPAANGQSGETDSGTVAQEASGGQNTGTDTLSGIAEAQTGASEPAATGGVSIGGDQIPLDQPIQIVVFSSISKVRIPFVKGWNLISIPMQPIDFMGRPIQHTAESFGRLVKADRIARWDPVAGAYAVYRVGSQVGDFKLIPGSGYFIEAVEASEIELVGPDSSGSGSALKPGWNLMGHSSTVTTARAYASKWDGIDIISIFDQESQNWKDFLANHPSEDIPILPGNGVFVHMGHDGVLTDCSHGSGGADQGIPFPRWTTGVSGQDASSGSLGNQGGSSSGESGTGGQPGSQETGSGSATGSMLQDSPQVPAVAGYSSGGGGGGFEAASVIYEAPGGEAQEDGESDTGSNEADAGSDSGASVPVGKPVPKERIEALIEKSIMRGSEEGTSGTKTFRRAQFVALVMKTLGIAPIPGLTDTSFDDVGKNLRKAIPYLETARILGIVQGQLVNDHLQFRPFDPVTRAEGLAIVLKAAQIEGSTAQDTLFPDVTSDWMLPYISKAHDLGIISDGSGDGRVRFRPGRPLTQEEAVKILSRVVGITSR